MDIIQKILVETDVTEESDFFSDSEKNYEILKWFKKDLDSIKQINREAEIYENHMPLTDEQPDIMDEPSEDISMKRIKYGKTDSYVGLNHYVWQHLHASEKVKTIEWFQKIITDKFDIAQLPIYLTLDSNVPVIVDKKENMEMYKNLPYTKEVELGEKAIYINPKYIEFDNYIQYEIVDKMVGFAVENWIKKNKNKIKSGKLNLDQKNILNQILKPGDFDTENEYKKNLKVLLKNVDSNIEEPENNAYFESMIWHEDELDKIDLDNEGEKELAVFGNQPIEKAKNSGFDMITEYYQAAESVLKTQDVLWREYKAVKDDMASAYNKFYNNHYSEHKKPDFYEAVIYHIRKQEREERKAHEEAFSKNNEEQDLDLSK